MGLADGHAGTDFYAKIVTRNFRFVLTPLLRSNPDDIESILIRAIAQLQRMVNHYAKRKRLLHSRGGTTFTVCVIDKVRSLAFFANLGDSPGFVLSKNSLAPGYSIKFRTTDHDIHSEEERRRIISVNPHVRFSDNYMFLPNGDQIMTLRGFGDYAYGQTIGRVPDCYTVALAPNDVVILSSDGILEKYENGLLKPGRDEQEICEDVSIAIESKQHIGFVLIHKKIERLANAVIKLYPESKRSPELLELCVKTVETNMDNHMISVYVFEQVEEVDLSVLPLVPCSLLRSLST